MKLAIINIKSIDAETSKAILVNSNIWLPKSCIIKKEVDHWVVKKSILQNKDIEFKETTLLEQLDISNLKPLKHLINYNIVSYFPKDAMEHQLEVFKKAIGLKSVALPMDTGTGKSKLYIDLTNYHYTIGNINKVICFAPPTTLDNFSNEIKLWNNSSLEWCIKSINELSCKQFSKKYNDLLSSIDKKTMIIIDESHRIKNPFSLMSKTAYYMGLKTDFKIIGTGTPYGNDVVDLLGQYRFLVPAEFNMSQNQFKKHYLIIGDKGILKSCKNSLEILRKTFPYTFSVKKEDCLNLPSKIFNKINIEDNKLIKHYKNSINEATKMFLSKGSLMGYLQNLRKLSSGRNLKNEVIVKNPKINSLNDILLDIKEKVIIWHNFYFEIDDILQVINKNYVLLNGDMTESEKIYSINEFKNNDSIKYLIATESVGGVGLNFTESCINIFFSNSFSLIDRLQAQDRINRIGQEKQCIYYDLIIPNTVESRIMKSIDRKQDFLEEIKFIFKQEGKKKVVEVLNESL